MKISMEENLISNEHLKIHSILWIAHNLYLKGKIFLNMQVKVKTYICWINHSSVSVRDI